MNELLAVKHSRVPDGRRPKRLPGSTVRPPGAGAKAGRNQPAGAPFTLSKDRRKINWRRELEPKQAAAFQPFSRASGDTSQTHTVRRGLRKAGKVLSRAAATPNCQARGLRFPRGSLGGCTANFAERVNRATLVLNKWYKTCRLGRVAPPPASLAVCRLSLCERMPFCGAKGDYGDARPSRDCRGRLLVRDRCGANQLLNGRVQVIVQRQLPLRRMPPQMVIRLESQKRSIG